jgi:hypothetical protein
MAKASRRVAKRWTEIPSAPSDASIKKFAEDHTKIQQWIAFIPDVAIQPGPLVEVCGSLTDSLSGMRRMRGIRRPKSRKA